MNSGMSEIGPKLGEDWHQMGQNWDYLKSGYSTFLFQQAKMY